MPGKRGARSRRRPGTSTSRPCGRSLGSAVATAGCRRMSPTGSNIAEGRLIGPKQFLTPSLTGCGGAMTWRCARRHCGGCCMRPPRERRMSSRSTFKRLLRSSKHAAFLGPPPAKRGPRTSRSRSRECDRPLPLGLSIACVAKDSSRRSARWRLPCRPCNRPVPRRREDKSSRAEPSPRTLGSGREQQRGAAGGDDCSGRRVVRQCQRSPEVPSCDRENSPLG